MSPPAIQLPLAIDVNVMSNLIIRTRTERNLSLRVAAAQMNMSKATLSRLENKTLPTFDTMIKLCNWLEITPDQLLGLRSVNVLIRPTHTSTTR